MIRLLSVLVALVALAAVAQASGLDLARQAQEAESRREFEKASQLYTKAINSGDLNARQVADAMRYRGNAHYFLGRFGLAAEDYVNSLKRNPDNLYAALWLFMTREHAGQDGLPELRRVAARRDLFYWPGPIVALFLGQGSITDVLEAAKDPFLDDKTQREQSCEAYFYAGQYALLQGDKAAAARLFRGALQTGITAFIEYDAARMALEGLGG